jgi:hypothetical protein
MKIRTVGRTGMKLIVAFRNFAKATKKFHFTFKTHFINANDTDYTYSRKDENQWLNQGNPKIQF